MSSVTLHVYDLSHGMARQLSPALLGKTIDGVWHTGVFVFHTEYFFGGGGIQAMAAELVAQRYGMQPVRTIALGETRRTQRELEQFLAEQRARYTDATYDLLRHNCNNFSDHVATFLVGSGIPQYILDLPNEALNSPFGATLRPMLENMNRQMHASAGDQLFSIPFNDPSRANAEVSPLAPAAPAASTAATASVGRSAPRLKITGAPALYVDKILQRMDALNSEQRIVSDDEMAALNAVVAHVTAATPDQELESTIVEASWKAINKLVALGHEAALFFPALGLFRVLLLLQPASSALEAGAEKKACFEAVVRETDAASVQLTPAQKTLVLSVLLNAFANAGCCDMALSSSPRFLPFVFTAISDPSTSHEARVLSAHIISNCCVALKMGEEVVITTIVCGAVETLDRVSKLPSLALQQPTIEGLIVGLGHLLFNFEAARSLSTDLGLADVLRRLHIAPSCRAMQPLLAEIVALI